MRSVVGLLITAVVITILWFSVVDNPDGDWMLYIPLGIGLIAGLWTAVHQLKQSSRMQYVVTNKRVFQLYNHSAEAIDISKISHIVINRNLIDRIPWVQSGSIKLILRQLPGSSYKRGIILQSVDQYWQ